MLLDSANANAHGMRTVRPRRDLDAASEPADHRQFFVVERRSELSVMEFRRRYLRPRIPVILSDASAHWPIHGRGTPDYFRSRYGKVPVALLGQRMTLAELLDQLEDSTPANPAPYPCKFGIAEKFRPLLEQISPRIGFSIPDRQNSALLPQRLLDGVDNLEIFFGGPGGKFPYLHYDVLHLHAWITQLHGEKEFVLYAPNQQPFLYAKADVPWQSDIADHHAADFDRYPLFRQARAHRVTIHPGDTLFLPCGWWHTARSLSTTISVAHDQLASDNWSDFARDVVAERRRNGRPVVAAALGTYLRLISPLLAIAEALGHRDSGWGNR